MYKKFLLLILMIFSLVSFQPLGAIFTNDPVRRGQELVLNVNIDNDLNYKIKDMQVRAFVYDLGEVFSSNEFDVGRGDTVTSRLNWEVPEDIPLGEYVIKVSASHDRFRHSKHIFIEVI